MTMDDPRHATPNASTARKAFGNQGRPATVPDVGTTRTATQPAMGGMGGSLNQIGRPPFGTTGSGSGGDRTGTRTPSPIDRVQPSSEVSIDPRTAAPAPMETSGRHLFRPVQLDDNRTPASYSRDPVGTRARLIAHIPTALMLLMVCTSSFSIAVAWMTDTRPPMVLHRIDVLTPVARQCGAIFYRATYDKRVECSPPAGSGEVHYRFSSVSEKPDPYGQVVRDNVSGIRGAAWLPGVGMTGEGAANVPCDLPPGDYALITTSIYLCARAPHLLQTVSQPLLVKVLAKE